MVLMEEHLIHLYIYISVHFDSFGVEHIPKDIKKFIGNKNIITNIYRIQTYHSIMCGYYVLNLLIYVKR